jgi:hypothetical protein
MTTVAKLRNTGRLELLSGEVNERMPAVTNGLVCNFPFDGPGGVFDGISGYGTSQNVEQGLNLVEALNINWRDPSAWASSSGFTWDEDKQAMRIQGYRNTWLKTPFIINPNKKYFCSIEVMVESRVHSSGTGEGYLYVGGYSVNAAGQMVTPNYDYSIAAAYRPTLGQWVTLRLCRTGTGTLNSRTSFSFATTDGWMGTTTNAAVTDKLTKYWYFGGLWNYACNADAVVYIRNMSVICMDPDTSGCTHTSYGMALEVPTTNLWVGGFTIYNNYGVTASLTKLNETYMGQPVYRLAMTPTSSSVADFQGNWSSHGVYGSSITYLANTKYVNSIFWRCVNKPDISVGNTASNIGGWSYGPTVKYSDGWNRTSAYRDGTVTTDKTGHVFFSFRSPSAQAGETIYVDWACPQIEKGIIFPTSYVNGSRATDGRADINIALTPPYSINLEFTPLCPNDHNVVNVVFSSDFTIDNNKLLIWKRDTENYYRIRVLSVDTTFTSNEIVRDVKATITVTVSSTQTKIYLNGVLKNTVAQAPTITSSISLGECLSSITSFNAYNSLSIYNRVLTDNEISKLTVSKLRLMSNGDLREIIMESPPHIPADAYYWPLSNDCYDITHQFGPSEATNLAFEDGAVWVGTATENFYVTKAGSPAIYGNNGATVSNVHDTFPSILVDQGCNKVWRCEKTGSANQWHGWESAYSGFGGVNGDVFVASVYYKTKAPAGLTYISGMVPYTTDWTTAIGTGIDDATSRIIIADNDWHRCYTACKLTQDAASFIAADATGWGYSTQAGLLYFTGMQWEKGRNFPTPYTSGTRGISSLEFNLNSSIGLQWNADFSIVYWKKPLGTHTSGLTGYSLDSIGCNSNSVGGSYVWFGKPDGSNTISGSSPSAIDPAIYFNNWRMVSMVRSGSTITIKEWEKGGTVYTRTITGPSVANAFVTQYGYDLKFGGWDNGSACNSYYRDLIVAKRAFTDAELMEMYKTQIRLDKDTLCIQHKIIEV